jgi:hypothetical protein
MKMINKLKSLLETGAYDGMSDAEVADVLNLEVTEQCEYMLTDIRLAALIGTVKTVAVIEAFKASGDAVSLWIVEKLATTGLDIGNVEAPALVQPLITATVITQEDADKVLSMGTFKTTAAKRAGIQTPVLAPMITEARK